MFVYYTNGFRTFLADKQKISPEGGLLTILQD